MVELTFEEPKCLAANPPGLQTLGLVRDIIVDVSLECEAKKAASLL